jgi:Putative transposase.
MREIIWQESGVGLNLRRVGNSLRASTPFGSKQPKPAHRYAPTIPFTVEALSTLPWTECPDFVEYALLHGLPDGFHRIRHYGLLANATRRENLARARNLLHAPQPDPVSDEIEVIPQPTFVCRCCGAVMQVVEIFPRQQSIRAPP